MRKAELPGLTGVRFYAALPVYVSHVVGTIPGMQALGGSLLVFNAGELSVAFFFVLSGFVLAYNYLDRFQDGLSLSSYKLFLWNRLARVYPVHLLATLMVLPVAIMSPNLPLDWRAVPVHLLLLQNWWPAVSPAFLTYLNVPSWSLSCEWFFYVIAPLAIVYSSGNRRLLVTAGIALCYAGVLGGVLAQYGSAYARHYFVAWFAPSRCIEFLAGVLLARAYLGTVNRRIVEWSVAAQAAGVGLILIGAILWQSAPWPLSGGLLTLPGSALLIWGLATGRGYFVVHLSHRWLNRLGVASFSFYMIHAPLLRAMKGAWLYLGWEVHSWPLFWGVTATLFVLIQVAALGVCYFYELPLQHRLRTFDRGA